MIFAFMLAITAIGSLAYWIGAFLNFSFITWGAHIFMLLLSGGTFMIHWVCGLIFVLLFDGLYLLVCGFANERFCYHGSSFF